MLIPTIAFPNVPLARSWVGGSVERWSVESEWTGSVTTARYQYDLLLLLPASTERKAGEPLDASFRVVNLRATQNETALPPVKLGGVFATKFHPQGPPLELHMAGPPATLGLPLLAWQLPTALTAGEIPLSTQVDTGVNAVGSGRFSAIRRDRARLWIDLRIGPTEMPAAERTVTVQALVWIRLKTSSVESVDGQVVDPNGTLKFKIRRI